MRRLLIAPLLGRPAGVWVEAPADQWAQAARSAGSPLATLALDEQQAAAVVVAALAAGGPAAADARPQGRRR